MRAARSVRGADDLFDGRGISTSELRAIALENRPGLDRHLALLLLGERRYTARVADLARVLGDVRAPRRLRAAAAEMLGRRATPSAIDALRGALAVDDRVVLRSVASALGRTAGPASLPDLDRVAAAGGLSARAAAAAATLVRFRHGDPAGALPAAGRLLRPAAGAVTRLPVRPAPKAVAEAAADARTDLSGLRVVTSRAVAFTCDESRVIVLPTNHGGAADVVARMRTRRLVLAAVVEQLAIEDDGWEVDALVLSEPAGADRARVAVVGRSGTLRMDGEAVLTGRTAEITLARIEAPGAVPAEVVARLREGRLRILRLEVGTVRHPPLAPVRLAPERVAGGRRARR